jgi:hypothetical protein
MILLITASPKGAECASAIQKDTREQTLVAGTVERAAKMVRAGDYSALLIDTSLLELDLLAADTFWRHAGNAIPVWCNLAISSKERVVREVQMALKRRTRERQVAMRAARSLVRNELRDAVTGILLSSEMVLQDRSLPENLAAKLKSLRELAREMKTRLDTSS